VSLVREPSVQQSGVIAVTVPKEMATSGTGFAFALPSQTTGTETSTPATVTTVSGQTLPGWLKYSAETKSLVASAVPDGGLPITVVVHAGGTETTIVISENTQ